MLWPCMWSRPSHCTYRQDRILLTRRGAESVLPASVQGIETSACCFPSRRIAGVDGQLEGRACGLYVALLGQQNSKVDCCFGGLVGVQHLIGSIQLNRSDAADEMQCLHLGGRR